MLAVYVPTYIYIDSIYRSPKTIRAHHEGTVSISVSSQSPMTIIIIIIKYIYNKIPT